MATVITSECINCGACEPECPNTAIYQGGVEWELGGVKHPPLSNDIFYIVPEKCTECVGFYDQEACAAVCPVDCCVPDPDRVESEEELIGRAKVLHPEVELGGEFPSRFRKGEGRGVTVGAGVGGDGAAEAGEAQAASAPSPAPTAPPAAPIATAKPAPTPARVEKKVEKPAAPPAPKPVVEKLFPGELAGSFEQALERVQERKGNPFLGAIVAIAQPLLGALPFSTKKALEEMIGDKRYFTAAGSTGLNILCNMTLYPAIFLAVAVFGLGKEAFSSSTYAYIALGLTIASLEAILRLREAIFQATPIDQAPCRGTFYGLPLAPLLAPFLFPPAQSTGKVSFDGYYSPEFDDKLERERRYGEVYTVEERGNAYLVRLEFPRRIPPSAWKREQGIPDEMPDYDYDLSLRNGSFVVRGKVVDLQVRRLAAVAPSFPPDFTTRIDLEREVSAFKHRYQDKKLEVVLFKK